MNYISRNYISKGSPYNMHLIYGCRNLSDVPYLEELKARSEQLSRWRLADYMGSPRDRRVLFYLRAVTIKNYVTKQGGKLKNRKNQNPKDILDYGIYRDIY